jgi:hypothetical protein
VLSVERSYNAVRRTRDLRFIIVIHFGFWTATKNPAGRVLRESERVKGIDLLGTSGWD